MTRLGPKQRRKIGNEEMCEWLTERNHGSGMKDFDRDWNKLWLMYSLLGGFDSERGRQKWDMYERTRDILSAWEEVYRKLKKSKGEKYDRLGN